MDPQQQILKERIEQKKREIAALKAETARAKAEYDLALLMEQIYYNLFGI
jgi:hypothetical protein